MQVLPNEGRFAPNQKVVVLRNKIIKFIEEHIYPMEEEFNKLARSEARWTIHPAEEKLKELAKKEGLWNLWIPVCILILLFCNIFYLYFVVSRKKS
jgi:acyl-CoA dehydrogenase